MADKSGDAYSFPTLDQGHGQGQVSKEEERESGSAEETFVRQKEVKDGHPLEGEEGGAPEEERESGSAEETFVRQKEVKDGHPLEGEEGGAPEEGDEDEEGSAGEGTLILGHLSMLLGVVSYGSSQAGILSNYCSIC